MKRIIPFLALSIVILSAQIASADNTEKNFKLTEKDGYTELQWSNESDNKIDIYGDLSVEDETIKLKGKKNEYQIPHSVYAVTETVKQEVQLENAEVVKTSIIIADDKEGNEEAQYEFEVIEKRKLFWLIPIDVKAKLRIGLEDNELKEIKYGLLGIFFINKEYLLNIVAAPNLVVSNVGISPKSLHTGNEMQIKVTVTNQGVESSAVTPDNEETSSRIALYFGDDLQIQSENTNFILQPGESESHTMKWDSILCDVPITIVIDPDNRIEESNEGDNVWQYQVQCAPTDAPDLVVESTYFPNGSKPIGESNTLRYKIKNQGTQPSETTNAEITIGDSKVNEPVLPLEPNESYTGEYTYTVQDCNDIVITLDNLNNITETDEDNNTAREPAGDCQSTQKTPLKPSLPTNK